MERAIGPEHAEAYWTALSGQGGGRLYGELLLQADRAKDAIVWFERAFVRTPNRSRAVLGLARAAAKQADHASRRPTSGSSRIGAGRSGFTRVKEAQTALK